MYLNILIYVVIDITTVCLYSNTIAPRRPLKQDAISDLYSIHEYSSASRAIDDL